MGGPSSQFLKGAHSLALKDPQKAKLDEIQKGLEGDHGKPPEEMKTLQADLIAGVKAGKLDTAKIDAHYAAIEKAMQAHLTKEAEGLNALHALLEPAQRTALVADLRAKMAKRLEHMGKDKDAHGPGDAGAANHSKRMLEHLTQDLGLDADQQKKVEAILPKQDPKAGGDMMAEMKKHHEALLAAFEKDAFDAKKLESFDVKKAHGPITHESQFIGQLLAILKPEQREKLATRLEKGGMGPHDGHHGGGGGGGHHGKPGDDDDDD
jgi:Spy/CpxP family protein refolding chaperone